MGNTHDMDHSSGTASGKFIVESISRGTNQGGMRESNERVVLTMLRRNPNIAKAEIARATGLSAQTVSRLINALELDGLILRGKPQKGQIGQPSLPLTLNPLGAVFLGMKVGRRSVEMIITDFMGTIIDREKRTYDYPDFEDVLNFADTASKALQGRLPENLKSRVAGLGIAMPFFLWNWARQIGVESALMANWEHRDLHFEVAERLDMPVFLQNDATAACSAEMVFGKNAMPANSLFFFVAFFIGGGLILGNTLYTGTTGNAAGFGPLRVPGLTGEPKTLIDVASLVTLEKELLRKGCDTRTMWIDPDNWDFPQVILDHWVQECAHGLAHAIRSTQTILDLETVFVDGWMPRELQADLTAKVQAEVLDLDMTGMHRPKISAGTLGADARVLGAASLPLSQRFLVN